MVLGVAVDEVYKRQLVVLFVLNIVNELVVKQVVGRKSR